MPEPRRGAAGIAAFLVFLGCIPLANWLIPHVGTTCVPRGPCLVPVAPGVMAPSGVLTVGVALVPRDVVQRYLGLRCGLIAVAAGTAFALSELADFAVYTPRQRRRLLAAVVASSLGGLLVDSIMFLSLAFGGREFRPGQIIGKAWAVLFAIPLVRLLRRVAPTPA